MRILLAIALALLALAPAASATVPVLGGHDATFAGSTDGSVYAIAVQPDGKVIVGGDFNNADGTPHAYLARLDADGSIDETFHGGTAVGLDDNVFAIGLQADGGIVIGGSFANVDGVAASRVARLHADGTVDASFLGAADDAVYAIAVQPDSRVVIGGDFTTADGTAREHVARLLADGGIDNTFDGPAMLDVDGSVRAVAVDADGRVVIGGLFNTVGGATRNHVARLSASGTLDAAFDPDVNGMVRGLALQPDGGILIGGSFATVNGVTRHAIARVLASGANDPGFFHDADLEVDSSVQGIAVRADGRIVIGGGFVLVEGAPHQRLAMLEPDGSVVAAFASSASDYVTVVANQPDGKVVVGGDFLDLDGESAPYVGRIHAGAPNAAPTSPVAVMPASEQAAVVWQPVPGDIATYTVTSHPGGRTCTAAAPATTCTITGLPNGRWYSFSVVAENAFGAGPASVLSNQVLHARDATFVRIRGASGHVRHGRVTLRILTSGAGRLTATGTYRGVEVCTGAARVGADGARRMACVATAAGRRLLADHGRTVRLRVRFTPTGKAAVFATRSVLMPRYTPTPTPVTG